MQTLLARFQRLFWLAKSPLAIGLGAIMALIILLGSIRWPLSGEVIGAHLRHALERNTGYGVERLGSVHFTGLPWPTLQVENLVLVKPSSPQERVAAPLLKARLNLGSWLVGDPKVVALSLFDPTIHHVSNMAFNETEALSTAVFNFLARERRPELKSLRITRGTIMLDGRPWMNDVLLNVTNTAGSDLRLRADGFYRSKPIAIKADIGQGGSPDRRPFNWIVALPSANARFDGILFSPRSLDAEGNLSLMIIDGPEFAAALELGRRQAAFFTDTRLAGQARIVWPMIQIKDAVITRGKEQIDGSVEVTLDKRSPALSATLDTKRLDLTPLVSTLIGHETLRTGAWPTEPLTFSMMQGARMDLRLSTDILQVGSLAIGKVALSGHLRDGRIEVLLSEGSIGNGAIKGRMALGPSQIPAQGLDLKAQGSFERLDLGDLLATAGLGRPRGIAAGQFALQTSGASWAALVHALDGRMQATLREGELQGVDLDRLAGRIERTLAGSIAMDGRTRFQSLGLHLRITQGIAAISEGMLVTPALRIPLEGNINIPDQKLHITARIQPGNDGQKAGEMRLRLEGPWIAPTLTPDMVGRGGRS